MAEKGLGGLSNSPVYIEVYSSRNYRIYSLTIQFLHLPCAKCSIFSCCLSSLLAAKVHNMREHGYDLSFLFHYQVIF